MAGAGNCSWYEFALEIFSQAGVVTRCWRSTTDMLDRPAERPANSVLGSGREAPIRLPDWQRGLADYLEREAPEPEQVKPARAGSTVAASPCWTCTRRGRGGGRGPAGQVEED